jgi:hypothetical protein
MEWMMTRMSRPTALFALCFLLLLPVAVLPASAGDWAGKEIKEGGVTRVMNPAKPMTPPAELKPQVAWRIGGFDDDEIFGVITSVIQDEQSGEFYMLDAQLTEIKVYSEDGEWLRNIGREGEGPGEWRFAFSIFFTPDNNIGVLQAFPPKIVMITPEGDPAGEYPLPEAQGEGFQIIIAAAPAGENLAIVQMTNQQVDGGFKMGELLTLSPKNSSESKTLQTNETTLNLSNPVINEKAWSNMRNGRWAAFDDGRAAAAANFDDYRINVYGGDGSLDRVIECEYPAHTRTKAEKDWVLDVFERSTARQMPLPNKRFEISETHSPVGSLRSRNDGSLWVQSSRGQFGIPDDVIGIYDVFDAKGRFAQQLALKGDADPVNDLVAFVGDYVLVITDFLPSIVALQGGTASEEEEDEEAEPMQVICFRLDAPKLGMK